MKLKLLLLLLLFVGILNAQEPYRQLMITECYTQSPARDYVEITNVGNKTINLGEFRFGTLGLSHTRILDVNVDPWIPQTPYGTYVFMLPEVQLAPGKSFVIATAYDFGPEQYKKSPFALGAVERPKKVDIYNVSDLLLHLPETNGDGTDSITLGRYQYHALNLWDGRTCIFLEHHYTDSDSAVIDQFGGVFDPCEILARHTMSQG